MIFLALGGFICLIVAALVYSQAAARKLRSADWESLTASIEPMHARGLEMVAMDHMQPQANQLRLEPDEIWALVGGMEGLNRMRRNADRMVALAAYVQRWNFEEAIIIAERIRQDSILLKRALFRLKVEMFFHRTPIRIPFHIHQAASSYYLMSKRLLTLYEANQYILYPRLASAL
jgi:hypothetical protein